jgi:2-dehydropantoate 2-reductase
VRVAIIGAGGVGAYYGGLLARAGTPVHLFARGAHLDALRARGLEVHTPEGNWRCPVHATGDPGALAREIGDGDLAVVAVKAYSLAEVAPVVRLLAERGAAVLPLLNGVDAVDRLAGLGVAPASVLGGVTYISAARTVPGVVERRSPFQRVIVGEAAGGVSERAARVAALFAAAGADALAVDDVALALWQKFVFIVSLAAACGLARSPVGPLRETPLGRRLIERAVREAVAVGRARGVALPDGEEERVLALIASLPAAMTPSFLLDLQARRPTEIDVLSGAVARFAAAAGIDAPVHETAAAALAPLVRAGRHDR